MLSHILVVLDGGERANSVASFGSDMARRYDAAVDVLDLHESDPGDDTETTDEGAASPLDSLDAALPSGAEVHHIDGQPSKVVVDFASQHGVDLVVMADQDREGLGDQLLGSVTERVLRRSHVPTLVVRGEQQDVPDIDDVLVTTDGSDVAERAAPYASDLTTRFEGALHVLTAVDVQAEGGVFNAGGLPKEFVERLEARGRDAVDRFVDAVDESIECHRAVIRGTPHEVVAEYVDENDVDLLVMATEGQNNVVGQRLGSVAARILRTVNLPVLIVPTPE